MTATTVTPAFTRPAPHRCPPGVVRPNRACGVDQVLDRPLHRLDARGDRGHHGRHQRPGGVGHHDRCGRRRNRANEHRPIAHAGYQMAQLSVAVLGVLTIAGEYSTGMIRSTLAAVPRRLRAHRQGSGAQRRRAGITVVSMALSYVATMPWHEQLNAQFDLTDAETLRMTVALPLYLMAIAGFAFVIGALFRHSAAALTAVIALLLVVENVLMIIPLRAVELISPFLPSTAGRLLLFDNEMLDTAAGMTAGAHLSPWQGYAVLVGWVIALGTVAAVLLRRRDA